MCCGESEDEETSMMHHSLDEEERNDVFEKIMIVCGKIDMIIFMMNVKIKC